MSKKTRIITITAIVVLIAAMALYSPIRRALSSGDELEAGAPVTPRQGRSSLNVNAQIMQYSNLSEEFISVGKLLPDEEVDLAFETSGKITDILLEEGTYVRKGQLLAKVNDKPLQAELKKLEAQVPLAEDRVKRQQALLQRDAVSQESYESVVTELEKLRADIELVKARIAQTELRAPFDGMIGLRNVSEGAYVSSSTIVSTLTRITPLKVEFSVNQNQLNDVTAGTQIEFTTGLGDRNVYRASVYAVESRLDPSMITLKARARYANADGRLKPGQSISISMNLRQLGTALVVPSLAIVAEMGRDIVYVYENGTARQVTVEKGMRTEKAVQITQGLSVGDTLITTGVMQLRDGMPVTLNQLAVPDAY